MTLTEKVAHLKGVIEGMELADDKNSKLIKEIADILEDMAMTVSDLEDDTATLYDYVDELDQDLGEVEEYVYDVEDDDCDCCDCDDCCEDEVVEVTCPKCGATVFLDIDDDDFDDIICTECGEHFDCCCDCDCDCED